MDPEATLSNMRGLADVITSHGDSAYAEELAEAFQALDDWLSKGGFLPVAWEQARRPYVTKTGRILTDADIEYLAEQAERD